MEEKLKTLYELCETISRELEESNEKIRKAGGKLSSGDLDVIDKMTHAMKSLKTTIAMMESEEDGGYSSRGNYSNRFMPWYGGMSYERGGNSSREGNSYEGGSSYARGSRGGRGGNNNPTGRNQYSREGGYSYAEDMESTKEEIRELSMKMPEEHRRKIERVLDDLR